VGPWRIEGYIGRGSYGAVFQARRAGHPSSPPVALKVALCSYDPRFVREEVLLDRVRHPSVPQLIEGEHVQREAPAQQPGPIQPRRALLGRLLPRRC
jgi:serine/threonine protein kinase